jgi:CYTH domain-containing protein
MTLMGNMILESAETNLAKGYQKACNKIIQTVQTIVAPFHPECVRTDAEKRQVLAIRGNTTALERFEYNQIAPMSDPRGNLFKMNEDDLAEQRQLFTQSTKISFWGAL